MRRLCFFLLLSSMAVGQGSFIPPQQVLKVVNGITSPVPLATVTVCAANASGIPCTPALVGAIFKDAALTQPLSNPFTSDANGNYQFAIAAGTYTVTTTAFGFVGNSYQISVTAAGGGPPGGLNTNLQINNSGSFGGLANAALGSALVSQGLTSLPLFQSKPLLDVRDSAVNFDCTGTNPMDAAMQSIASTAHIIVPLGCVIKLASAHSYPQSFEFKQGGQLKPNTGVLITLTGPIIAGSYQIFSNALATQGGIDFTGNANSFDVLPEWWGASGASGQSATTNTTAIQAAIYGAFGCNVSPATTCRINGSNLNQYNKPLYLTGSYNIAGELHWYHVINFVVKGSGRLISGITQTATNSRIFDGQSDAFGTFRDLAFYSNVSQDLAHPLFDINFDNSQGADIKPEFIDFYNILWDGLGVAKTGVRIAAAGGNAQGSNINFYNNVAVSFTEAAYMIGSGSGCVPTNIATNAIQIMWLGGDMQANHAYGIEDFGGGGLVWDGGTAENGGNQNLGNVNQTGADFCANNIPNAGAFFTLKHVRSESPYMLAPTGGAGNSGPWNLIDVNTVDAISNHIAGGSAILGDLIEGETSCGHGYWYKVTTAGTFGGLASRTSPLTASAGSATTITDSVGGFTVNAFVGQYVCTVTAANTPPEYCLITSNTASVITCTAGFQTDYPYAGTQNPVNGTGYDIQPAWGATTITSGTATLTRDDTTYSGINLLLNSSFPGRRVVPNIGAVVSGLTVTRPDWAGSGSPFADAPIEPSTVDVLVGSPAVTAAGNTGVSLNPYYVRTWTLPRNSLGEVAFVNRKDYGTRVLHWFSGVSQGGSSAADVYIGTDAPAVPIAGQGDFFVLNNSSGSQKKWTFNFDGSTSMPAAIVSAGTAAGLSGTGACATLSTQSGGGFAGQVTCTGATAASTLVITPGTTAAHGFACSASDLTHTLVGSQSAVSTTACTMSFTSVTANDVVTFGVFSY